MPNSIEIKYKVVKNPKLVDVMSQKIKKGIQEKAQTGIDEQLHDDQHLIKSLKAKEDDLKLNLNIGILQAL